MTTIVATRKAIYADTLCGYTVPFKMSKIARIGDSIYAGAADDMDSVIKFLWWMRGEAGKPKLPSDEDFDVIEVGPSGIYLWSKYLTRVHVQQEYYAIGSGDQYAMGAIGTMAKFGMEIDPAKAIEVAALYDPNTKPPIESMSL